MLYFIKWWHHWNYQRLDFQTKNVLFILVHTWLYFYRCLGFIKINVVSAYTYMGNQTGLARTRTVKNFEKQKNPQMFTKYINDVILFHVFFKLWQNLCVMFISWTLWYCSGQTAPGHSWGFKSMTFKRKKIQKHS